MPQTLPLFAADEDRIEDAGPFLKWAGGKSQLLPELRKRLPKSWNRYFEPFIGGGALFFDVQPEQANLSDVNEELINAYRVVQTDVERLIRELKKHEHSEAYYYELRDADRLKYYARWSPVRRASRLLYLNKTCFNGLYRVNSHGYFNVPFGQYKNPRVCDPEMLRACSRVLQNTTLSVGSFEEVAFRAKAGDFVYFDPPYAPISKTSAFTAYARRGFGEELQVELRDVCDELTKRGVHFMLSNSHTELIMGLYKNYPIDVVFASRAINSQGSGRGKVREVIVTNY